MPSVAERTRNNVRAGVFVSITLVLALAVIISLTGAWRSLFYRTRDYIVTFDVSSGVKSLQAGSDVRVGGVLMGEVTRIEPQIKEGQAFDTIEVFFSLDERITLWTDAKVFVATPLIGSDAWLDIPHVGNPSSGLPAAGRIVGSQTVGLLTTLLGPANADKANEMVENTRQFTGFLSDVPKEYDQRVVPILDDAAESAKGVREIVTDVRDNRWPRWAESVDNVMTWATKATEELDATIAEGRGLLSDARGVIEENRPKVGSIVDNAQASSEDIKAASARVNGDILDKIDALLNTGQQGLDDARAVIATIQQDYDGWAVDVSDTLANLRLTGEQLKLTSIELRRSPWKLLYRPDAGELEHELLYEAARSFAVAASDLKAASASAQRILDRHGEDLGQDGGAFRRLQEHVMYSLSRYEKAQQELFDVLLLDSP